MRDQGSDDQVFYWLGLNRLAVEQWGTESGRDTTVFRPGGGEAGPDPEDDEWGISTGTDDHIGYVTDTERGNTIRIWNSDGGATKAVGHIGDSNTGGANPNGDPWNESERFHMSFWQKSDYAGNTFYIYATAVDGSMNTKHIQYFLTAGTGSAFRSTVYIHSPADLRRDGTWQFIELDFAELLAEAEPAWTLQEIDGIRFYAKDVYVDDIVLSGGSMARSYQVVPGMALGGTLGVQTGADGGEGVGAWETAYYHYNDLGTVLATTDDSGDVIGAWVPDYNGNYTNGYLGGYKYTCSPDRPEIGLTGKWFDDAAGLYYFNARWLDSERARWMSKEPTGADGPNLYHFVFNNSLIITDINGLQGGLHTVWLTNNQKDSSILSIVNSSTSLNDCIRNCRNAYKNRGIMININYEAMLDSWMYATAEMVNVLQEPLKECRHEMPETSQNLRYVVGFIQGVMYSAPVAITGASILSLSKFQKINNYFWFKNCKKACMQRFRDTPNNGGAPGYY